MRIGPVDTSVPTLAAVAFGVTVVIVVVIAASTSSAAFGAHNAGWEGLSEVRDEADATGVDTVVATEFEDYEQVNPDGTIVLLVDPATTSPEQRARLRTFVEGGGTVVVAAQEPEVANPLLSTLGTDVRVDGDRLRDEREHGASANFPLVTSVADHAYVADAEGMALNHGTVLTTDGEGFRAVDASVGGGTSDGDASDGAGDGPEALGNSSQFSYLDRDGNEVLSPDERLGSRTVIARELVGNGEVVAVSDPSTFINVMLDRRPNRAFVAGVLRDHDRLVLDQTDEDVPPVLASLLVVRTTSIPATLLAVALVGAILVWERRPLRSLQSRLGAGRGEVPRGERDAPVDREAVAEYVAERYPDLDDRHRDRVLGGIMKDQDKPRKHD